MVDFTALNSAAQALIDSATAPLNTQIVDLKSQLAAAQAKPSTVHNGPAVVFTATPRADNVLKIDFDASATTFSDGATGSVYSWNFDQSTYIATSPLAKGYVYNLPGQYTVTLSVKDSLGAVGTSTQIISVGEDSMIYFKGAAATVYVYNPLTGTKRALSAAELALVPNVAVSTITDAQVAAIKTAA